MSRALLCEKQLEGVPGMPSKHTLRAARTTRAPRLDVPAHVCVGGRVLYRIEDVRAWLAVHGLGDVDL